MVKLLLLASLLLSIAHGASWTISATSDGLTQAAVGRNKREQFKSIEKDDDAGSLPDRPCGPEHSAHCENGAGCKLHWTSFTGRWETICTCSVGWIGTRCNVMEERNCGPEHRNHCDHGTCKLRYAPDERKWNPSCACVDNRWYGERCEEEDTEYVPEPTCGPELRGHCAHKSVCKLSWAQLANRWDPTCTCSKGYIGKRCDQPHDVNVFGAHMTAGEGEGCYAAELHDGCQEGKPCEDLQANVTHVICKDLLWLNYGNEWLMDWQKISSVKCVDNVWKSDSSRVIGERQLVCANTPPSSMSTNLWLAIIGSAIVLVIIIAIVCAICCLSRRNHESYYVESSPEKTETTREE